MMEKKPNHVSVKRAQAVSFYLMLGAAGFVLWLMLLLRPGIFSKADANPAAVSTAVPAAPLPADPLDSMHEDYPDEAR